MIKAVLPSVALLVVLSSQAWAYLMTGNQRLDHAIYPEHDPKLIVAGEIVGKSVAPDTNSALLQPAEVNFQFKVTAVILGEAKYKGLTLTLPATSFMWPDDLLPFKTGTRCILVLRTKWGEKRDGYYIYVVVPSSSNALPVAKDGEEAKRIIEKEILAELENERSFTRQRALLLQVAPILRKKHSSKVLPFLKSKNIWVMRAALGALIYATEEEKYIRKMAADVQRFFTTTRSTDRINEKYAPYPYFFDHYFFLEKRSWTWGSRWNEDEAEKHLRVLNVMFNLGIISDEVKKILNSEPTDPGDKK